tara:strand:- start:3500 stop:3778 length:279 start_codon:yes stop_codon:yes gene_type:complete
MADYTITLTETEKLGMEYIAADVDEWITNSAINRARIAVEEIIQLNTAYCNANGIAIAVGVDAQVQQAYDLGVVGRLADAPTEPELPPIPES